MNILGNSFKAIRFCRHYALMLAVSYLFLILPAVSHAQVFRCVDEDTGKVTFTDRACPNKARGDYVPLNPTNSEAAYSASKSSNRNTTKTVPGGNALSANCQQAMENVKRYTREAERAVSRSVTSNKTMRASAMRDQAAAMEKARMYASICSSGGVAGASSRQVRQAPGTQKSAPIPVVPSLRPSVVHNCDSAGCWDDVGNRYNKGAGGTYFRTDGKVCQAVGGLMQCN